MAADYLIDLKDAIERRFACPGGLKIHRVQTKKLTYSEISRLEVTADGVPRVLYAKRVTALNVEDDPVKWSVTSEFEILDCLFRVFSPIPRLCVPLPIVALPEHRAIVTEEVPGVALVELIAKAVRVYALGGMDCALDEYCRLAGTWLRHFQSATARRNGDFDVDALLVYCESRLKFLAERSGSGIDTRFRNAFVRHLGDLSARVGRVENRITGRHNDYSPHNIVVNEGDIAVLDFGYFDYESYAYDVYRFWHHLECMKLNPLFSASRLCQLQDSFLAGYGMPVDFTRPLFRLVACRFYLVRLATIDEQTMRSGLRGRLDRRVYDSCYRWLLRECALT